MFYGLPSVVDVRRTLSNHISMRNQHDVNGFPLKDAKLTMKKTRSRFDRETPSTEKAAEQTPIVDHVQDADRMSKTLSEACLSDLLSQEAVVDFDSV